MDFYYNGNLFIRNAIIYLYENPDILSNTNYNNNNQQQVTSVIAFYRHEDPNQGWFTDTYDSSSPITDIDQTIWDDIRDDGTGNTYTNESVPHLIPWPNQNSIYMNEIANVTPTEYYLHPVNDLINWIKIDLQTQTQINRLYIGNVSDDPSHVQDRAIKLRVFICSGNTAPGFGINGDPSQDKANFDPDPNNDRSAYNIKPENMVWEGQAPSNTWNEINIDTIDVDGVPVTGRWIIILQIATENGMDLVEDHTLDTAPRVLVLY